MKKLARPEPPCVNIASVIVLKLPDVPGTNHSDETLKSLVALSDVMCIGHHAAVSGAV